MSADRPPRPSLLNRVARRLSDLRRLADDGVHALKEEAAHPGEPQPHRRGHNPFHQTVADLEAAEGAPSAAYQPGGDRSVDPLARPANDGTAGDDAWYLQGQDEGWTETDPSPPAQDGPSPARKQP